MSELLAAGERVGPWFVALLIVAGFLVYVIEKLGGRDGPFARMGAYFTDRELRALRKRGEIEAERQRQAQAQETHAITRYRRRLGDAYDEIDELESTVEWLIGERDDQRARDRARATFDHEQRAWLQEVITTVATQAPGVRLPDPPRPPAELVDLLVVGAADQHPRRRSPTRRPRREELEEQWAQEDAGDLEPDPEELSSGGRRGRRLQDRSSRPRD